MDTETLLKAVNERFSTLASHIELKDMVTVDLSAENLLEACTALRDESPFQFDQLMDVCGVDYLDYGISDWRTEETTLSGFSRGVDTSKQERVISWDKPRFGVVYHLLSVAKNHRVRLKVYLGGEPTLPSVINIWASANWFEREAFDLFGIVFDGHPDLRRLLTDYGFVGHPFRKDFPLIGEVEMRYDAAQQRCIYEPVSIMPRVLVPKVIRHDNRYLHSEGEVNEND